ncbi:MAG: response regulator [Bacteroidia bacterium]|nr:response regulator [Bacteroidia bacterium]
MEDQGKIRVLFVDDELHNLEAFKAAFRRDYEVHICLSVAEAMQLLESTEMHVILSDQRMPNTTGVEFFEQILELYPDSIRILITGYADIGIVVDAVNKGKIYQYIQKPWDNQNLKEIIDKAYEEYNAQITKKKDLEELRVLNEQLEFLARQNIIS